MVRFIFFPAFTCLSLPYWPVLMPEKVTFLCLFIAFLGLLNRYTRLTSCILLGLLWTNYTATEYAQNVEQVFQNQGYITTDGVVDSLIYEKKSSQSVIWVTDPTSLDASSVEKRYRFRLFWKNAPELLGQGQRWRLKIKLKPVVSKLNGVGFDAERFYLSQHIHANATVVNANLLEDKSTLRQQFYLYIDKKLKNADIKNRGFILALSFAVRDFLSSETKLALRESGLLHLLAISGLHIGLAFYFAWWLGTRIAVLFAPSDRGYKYVWIFSLLGGFIYAWLAGFTLSSQRALIMGSVGLWYRHKGIPLTSYQPWIISFSLCLLYDPLASFSLSFYLSYFVVFMLLLMGQFFLSRKKTQVEQYSLWQVIKRYIRALVFLQLFLFIFMLPLQAYLFSGIAYLAPLFNLLVVPWVSLICVPLIFLSLLFPIFPILWFTDMSFMPLTYLLPYARGHWLSTYQMQCFLIDAVPDVGTINSIILIGSLICICYFFIKRYMFLLSTFCLLIYLFIRPIEPNQDEWKMSVLSVGHGLSVVIENNRDAIVYDVGRAWENGSMAQSILYPYLQKTLVKKLDGLILSHDDGDHVGDWQYLANNMPPHWMRSPSIRVDFLPCVRGERWEWKNLLLEVLWPLKLVEKAHNSDSCVIRISDQYHKVLLTGDIENIAQYQLLNLEKDMSADVIVIPHHGSKDASNQKWVQRVQAEYAINSSVKMGRWELPHPKVINSYARQGSWLLDTADHGRIDLFFNEKKIRLKTSREDYFPFWYRHLLNSKKSSRIECLLSKK